MTRSRSISILLLAAVGAACSQRDSKAGPPSDSGAAAAGSTTAAVTASERIADSIGSSGVPKAVADIGTHSENLYDQAKAANWTKVKVILDSLEQSAAGLNANERGQMAGVLDSLRSAVTAHRRESAIEAANQVTFLGAHFTEAYHPKMPADVVRLDYYGRELEIWAAQKNMTRLATTSADLRRTWEAVKPMVISHGGAAAAARTDSLVARLGSAKSAGDFARLATPILDVVDELEKPFEH